MLFRLYSLWYGKKQEEQLQSELPEEIRMTCTQFTKYHKDQCFQDIVKKRRWEPPSWLLWKKINLWVNASFNSFKGVGRGLWRTVFLAVSLWSGCSGWAWLRTVARRCCMGHCYSRVVSSSTSSRNTTSKTVPSITALPRHKTQGSKSAFLFLAKWCM